MKLTTDEFLEKIGSFGRYQIVINIFFNLCYAFWWAIPVMISIFIASDPGWKCKNNSTCPFTETISLGDKRYNHRCDIPREDWEFNDDFTSVVTEFELVCERGSLGFVSTSVIFAAFFIGSLIVSSVSDKFGRKRPLFICGFICCIVHLVSAFSPAFWVFALFRAVVGFTIGAYSIPLFVLVTELSGIRYRGFAGGLVWTGFFLFTMVLAGVAYAIRDWRQLTIVTGIPGIFLAAGFFFIPESVRWLLKKGRVTEAREILSKVARLNGKEMPDEKLYLSSDEQNERLGDFRDLFISPRMIHKTLGSWLMWFAASFISWGIAFSAPFVGGNIYINVLISTVAGLPAYPISAVLTMRFGRRKILGVSFLLAAVGAIGTLLLSDKAEYDKGYMAGKIFMSMVVARFNSEIAFSLVYIYSAELFPTTVRNVGMGTSTASARVSAFASAYAPLLLEIHRFLPFGIMAGLASAAAIVCMTLPETLNKPTMEDLTQDKKKPIEEQNGNKITRDGKEEEDTLM
ncbi:organic cation transporter protein-like [Orbicella faveolata]|uniref:organic cation transporter protein-like n=1 Tax=Orbicella faveolata TaxID=48498 RepID=UPI0009E27B9B|nr:organic cation transporter protein-like [Orbicella faveolata]